MIIYKLTSPSGKVYIGQTQKTFKKRLSTHISATKSGKKNKINNAIRKYGLDNFTKEILYDTNNLDILNQKEMEYIKLFNSVNEGYNHTLGGEGTKGLKFSEEHLKNMSLSHLGIKQSSESIAKRQQTRKDNGHSMGKPKGGHLSDDHREKIKKIMLGRPSPMKGRKHSEQTRNLMRDSFSLMKQNGISLGRPKGTKQPIESVNRTRIANTGRKQPLESVLRRSGTYKITKPNGDIEIIKNLAQYCRDNNLNSSTMSQVALGNHKHHKQYKCEKL